MILDRFEIEAVGQNPTKLARAVHAQLGVINGAIPVNDIAFGLDIKSIETRALSGCEGALLTVSNKSKGAIVLKEGDRYERQRFTAAHELGHFLNDGHRPIKGLSGFQCTKNDMRVREGKRGKPLTKYERQELEANVFTAELLMPAYKLQPYLSRSPSLEHVLDIAKALDVSKEAAANRYVRLHDHSIAIVFSHNNTIRYIAKTDPFPRTLVWNNYALPREVMNATAGLSDIKDHDTDVWLSAPKTPSLDLQTLGQTNGHQMTLLVLRDSDSEDEDLGIETSFGRSERFNQLG